MGKQTDTNPQAPSCVGLLAHVDAGKTTLSEAMLYLTGRIKRLGRVDHRDSTLDHFALERARGITIFSKQAQLALPHRAVTLLDTPGHADLSAEMERTLPVLDCAVLVISATAGVQPHTETLWRLLRRYVLPCFIFVSKMDLPNPGREALMEQLHRRLDGGIVDFGAEDRDEQLAMCDETTMERYLEQGSLADEQLRELIGSRSVYPCFFGSGLKLDGVEALLDALDRFAPAQEDRGSFAARVYKISRDAQGQRLTWLKVTGGQLRVRTPLRYTSESGEETEEKCSQLRIYSGLKAESVEEVGTGQLCAVLGLSATWPGQSLGAEPDSGGPLLEPVLSYRVLLPQGADPAVVLRQLRQLEEEDPLLRLRWQEKNRQITASFMGSIQGELFKSLVKERFDLDLDLDQGQVLYRETIAEAVEGVGHFEPLRHYAEVHLLLQPLPQGSGLVLESLCPEDELDRNWQRLILTHLQERQHPGVLTGSPITDMKISLASGRAHLKHTEGGDFRQATYRALRQGLMKAECVLLEPWYAFTLELPPEQLGRAISDLRAMNGVFDSPEDGEGLLRLNGSAPVAALSGYGAELAAYSHGRGRLSLRPDGYRPCRRQQEIVESLGYDPLSDTENPCFSVFCAHGAGFNVPWDQVEDYMHLPSALKKPGEAPSLPPTRRSLSIDERELEAIMEREFGPIRRPAYREAQRNEAAPPMPAIEQRQEYLIVDGYNLIFAWDELKTLAAQQLDLARQRLMDMLSNYCGYTHAELVLVFDGYRSPGNPGERSAYHNIHVAYTKDGETGDAYIERLVDEIGRNYAVRVVTSDNLIRLSALRSGVLRTSSREFAGEVEWVLEQIDKVLAETNLAAHKTKVKDGLK